MKLGLQLNRLLGEAFVSWKQAEDFFTTTTSNFQAATQELTDTSSVAMQNAIAQARTQGFATSVTNWLQAHPVIFRFFNTIIWAIERPIISIAILVLTIVISLSIIKALNRLLETVGFSLLQAPFRLIARGFKLSWWGIRQNPHKNASNLAVNNANVIITHNPQQRLAEISQRLQVLQKEHNELLQEATAILELNKNR